MAPSPQPLDKAPPSPRKAADRPSSAETSRSAADPLRELRVGYRPMWDSARNAIASYLCVAQLPLSHIASAQIDAHQALADDVADLARLDAMLQQRVMTDLAELTTAGRRVLVTLPVHFNSLGQAAWRRRYLTEMTQLATNGRGLLMVEIIGVPQGVLQSRLLDLITPFRSLCRGVVLRLSADVIELAQIRGCGAAAIALDLEGRPGSESLLDQQMNRFARMAERASLRSYVHGAQTRSLVMAALGAGFDYIDGDALAKIVDRPWHAVEFQLAHLYDGTTLPGRGRSASSSEAGASDCASNRESPHRAESARPKP